MHHKLHQLGNIHPDLKDIPGLQIVHKIVFFRDRT